MSPPMLTRYVRLESIETPVVPNQSVATRTYVWKRSMRIRRWWMNFNPQGTATTPQMLTLVSVRISNQYGWYLATDGNGGQPSFLPLQLLFGRWGVGLARQRKSREWMPLGIEVKSGDIWTIEINNNQPLNIFPVMVVEVEDASADAGIAAA